MIKITNTGDGEIQLPFGVVIQPGATVEANDAAWAAIQFDAVVQSLLVFGVLVVETIKAKPVK